MGQNMIYIYLSPRAPSNAFPPIDWTDVIEIQILHNTLEYMGDNRLHNNSMEKI